MANISNETRESTKAMAGSATSAFSGLNSSMIRAIDKNRQIVQRMMQAVQDESLHFMNTRLEHTNRMIERSRDCHGLSELITLQHEWLIDVARDYVEATTRFGEVIREVSDRSADTFTEVISTAQNGPEGERRGKKRDGSGDRAAA